MSHGRGLGDATLAATTLLLPECRDELAANRVGVVPLDKDEAAEAAGMSVPLLPPLKQAVAELCIDPGEARLLVEDTRAAVETLHDPEFLTCEEVDEEAEGEVDEGADEGAATPSIQRTGVQEEQEEEGQLAEAMEDGSQELQAADNIAIEEVAVASSERIVTITTTAATATAAVQLVGKTAVLPSTMWQSEWHDAMLPKPMDVVVELDGSQLDEHFKVGGLVGGGPVNLSTCLIAVLVQKLGMHRRLSLSIPHVYTHSIALLHSFFPLKPSICVFF